MAKLLVALSVVAATAIVGCGFPVTRPVSQATYDSATFVGQVGALAEDFQGEWWFEYSGANEPRTFSTPRRPISVGAGTLQPVSATVTGLEAIGEPVIELQRVRAFGVRLCIQSPTIGPFCSRLQEEFHTGDYIKLVPGGFNAFPYSGIATITAESGPSGEEPSGHVDIDYTTPESEPSIVGSVTCLRAVGRFITLGVDNQQGPDVLLELGARSEDGRDPSYLEIMDPPADLSDCPDPDPPVIAGRIFVGLTGPGPQIVDGP
jgi:hypothetical protein